MWVYLPWFATWSFIHGTCEYVRLQYKDSVDFDFKSNKVYKMITENATFPLKEITD